MTVVDTTTPITTTVDLPESLFASMRAFLETHPGWSQDRVMTMALSLFLLQNGASDTVISQTYLDALTAPPVSDNVFEPLPVPAVSGNLLNNPRIAAILQAPSERAGG